MLTEKEACNLHNDIYQALATRGIHECLDLMTVLRRFTEKLKRKIQVGDIYRDKEGFIVEIVEENVENMVKHPLAVLSKCGYVYDKFDGKYRGEFDRADLDLSKRYELMEVKNVD